MCCMMVIDILFFNNWCVPVVYVVIVVARVVCA